MLLDRRDFNVKDELGVITLLLADMGDESISFMIFDRYPGLVVDNLMLSF